MVHLTARCLLLLPVFGMVLVGCFPDGSSTPPPQPQTQKSWQRVAAESVCAQLKTETNDEKRYDAREYVRGLLSLERGGNPDKQFANGNTLLMMAVRRNDKDIVKRMLSLDVYADVDCADKNGNTPLIVACEQGDAEMVKMLIEAGARINLQNSDGMTALMACAKQGGKATFRMLLDAGANARIRDASGKLFGDYALDNGHGGLISIVSERK